MREYTLADHKCEGLEKLLEQKRISYEWYVCNCSSLERHYQLLVSNKWKPIYCCPCCGESIYPYAYTNYGMVSNTFNTLSIIPSYNTIKSSGIINPSTFTYRTIFPSHNIGTLLSNPIIGVSQQEYYACSSTMATSNIETFELYHTKVDNKWVCNDPEKCYNIKDMIVIAEEL